MMEFRILLLEGLLTCSVILFQRCSAGDPPSVECTGEHEELNPSGRFSICTGKGDGYIGYPFVPQPACDCIEGYYRVNGFDSPCVELHDCPEDPDHFPPKCGPDEEYLKCGSACPPTCDNYGKPIRCTKQCVPGCYCKKDLVRDKDGHCIIPEKCEKDHCGVNEEYSACGSECQPTCDEPHPVCKRRCVKGCVCKKGFIRAEKGGKCVPEDFCFKDECGLNEYYDDCRIPCENTCKGSACIPECKKGCFCKDGFARCEMTGRCIPKPLCWKSQCGRNEYYDDCRIPCENTCRGSTCIPECKKGCFCKDGFARCEMTRRCIPKAQCWKRTPYH